MPLSWHVSTVADKKWAFLNGDVGFGDFHHQILERLGEHQNLHPMEQGMISNLGLVNSHPGDIGHNVAWGDFHDGYPVFWRTNVDRNHIWDAVQYAKGIAEPSPTEPVTANLREMAMIDTIRTSVTASGGRLEQVMPGDTYMDETGRPQELHAEPSDRARYYGANVVKAGAIIGSVSVELVTEPDGTTELVLQSSWVDPAYHGSDVGLQLYRWMRSNWPHDHLYGDLQHLDDYDRWQDTAVGAGDPTVQEAPYQPATYAGLAARAPWYIDPSGAVVVGSWGQIHRQIGLDDRSALQGDVARDGRVTLSSLRGPVAITTPTTEAERRDVEIAAFEHLCPHLRRAFGLAFAPSLQPLAPARDDRFELAPSSPPEASQSPPNGLRAVAQGIRRLFGKSSLTAPPPSSRFLGQEPGVDRGGIDPAFDTVAPPRHD